MCVFVCANVVVYGKVHVNKEKISVAKADCVHLQNINYVSIQKKL